MEKAPVPGASKVESAPSLPSAASAIGVPPIAPLPMKAPAIAANTAAAQTIRMVQEAFGGECMGRSPWLGGNFH